MSGVDPILQDIGRKCGDDVAGAIRRNMKLYGGPYEAMVICAYGAASAIGAANGAFAAHMGGDLVIDESLVDELWATILRPMILGNLAEHATPSLSAGGA